MNFISYFADVRQTHNIKMPWPVIGTNADSIPGNYLIWQPPVTKFLLRNYQMYAEARKINYWTLIVSAVIIGFTVFLMVKKKGRQKTFSISKERKKDGEGERFIG